MSDFVLSRALSPIGEVTDLIDLGVWRAAADALSGFTVTDTLPGTNPFTGQAILFPRPGSGVWVDDGRQHLVVFDCGAVVVRGCTPDDASRLESVAKRLGASVRPYATPIFSAKRMVLGTLLRRALGRLPARSDVFTTGRTYSVSTPTLLLEPSDGIVDVLSLAASLGFPDGLLPIECIEQLAESARVLKPDPPDTLLVKALEYFLEHDGFLPTEPTE